MKHLRVIISFLTVLSIFPPLNAYNIRQINSRDGLSNSAVICLYQDQDYYLWIGTYDGLNKYNGIDIETYKPNINDPNSISGNVIRKIVESKGDYLWIMTKWGLNKYSKKQNKVEAYFDEFKEECSVTRDSEGNIFVLTQAGILYYYDFDKKEFQKIDFPESKPYRGWVNLTIDFEDTVWITNNGIITQFVIDWTNSSFLRLVKIQNLDHPEAITHIFYDKENLIIVDRKGDLFLVRSGEKTFVKNLRPIIAERGDIASIIFDRNDILIAFRTSGLIKPDS